MTDDPDDPLLRPASDAGWDDVPVKPAASAKTVSAAPTVSTTPAVVVTPTIPPPKSPVVVADTKVLADTRVADTKVLADTRVADTKVLADTKVADTKVADTKVLADTKVADTKVADTKVADTKVLAEAKPTTDTKPTIDAKPSTDAKPTLVANETLEAKPTADVKPATADVKPATADAKPATADAKPATSDAKPVADEPLLPARYDENKLRAAVGVAPLATPTPRKRHAPLETDDEDDDAHAPRSRKTIAYTVLGVAAGLGLVALIILGRINSDRYVLACEPERAVPEQGRGFPPWGTRALGGEAWRPIKITAETRCQPHESDSVVTLQRLYLAMLLDQATAILSAREVTRVDDADVLLKQALLLTRPPEHESDALAAERTEHHKEIERMLGDVTYWRASARLRDASSSLTEAAKQFEAAAAQHPRHVSDAAAWATYARKLAQELRAGPTGAPTAGTPTAGAPTTTPTPIAPAAADRPTIPPGIALPIEPDKPDKPARDVAAPPDAGVPTGGVLL